MDTTRGLGTIPNPSSSSRAMPLLHVLRNDVVYHQNAFIPTLYHRREVAAEKGADIAIITTTILEK